MVCSKMLKKIVIIYIYYHIEKQNIVYCFRCFVTASVEFCSFRISISDPESKDSFFTLFYHFFGILRYIGLSINSIKTFLRSQGNSIVFQTLFLNTTRDIYFIKI